MPENKEMVGKALGKNKKFEKGVLTIPGYDSKKKYKLHITRVERLPGAELFDKIKIRGAGG